MSTSALSKETLSYTYTTVPTYTNAMVGYSNSNTALLTTSFTNQNQTNVLSISIANPGVYLCEGNIGYNTTNNINTYVMTSLSTTSAVLNTTNQTSTITNSRVSNLPTTAVITISVANTTLYCVGQAPDAPVGISNGFIKYTRIA
jgi:hypothetical protein